MQQASPLGLREHTSYMGSHSVTCQVILSPLPQPKLGLDLEGRIVSYVVNQISASGTVWIVAADVSGTPTFSEYSTFSTTPGSQSTEDINYSTPSEATAPKTDHMSSAATEEAATSALNAVAVAVGATVAGLILLALIIAAVSVLLYRY